MRLFVTVGALAGIAPSTNALSNGLGITPQMGYNSWYDLECSADMNEKVLQSRADFFATHGFKELGYEYFNLDDCYIAKGDAGRDAQGKLQADNTTFPSGMRALSDYVHKLGWKFGVYTDRGTKTCAGRSAAQGHETVDAQTYANDWQIDYLKEDSCNAPNVETVAFDQYGKMRDALNATGRPIFFSLCGWETWYAPKGYSLGNSWRMGPDDTNWAGILKNIDQNVELYSYAGPGGWNDPCLLLSTDHSGNERVTELQSRAQFSMWAVMASPLLISGNPEAFSDFTLATYTNPKVIAVNQDALGKQGQRILGGDLSRGSGGFPTVVLQECGSDASQQWLLDTPAPGYIQSKSGTNCLNADNCQSDLIVYNACPTTDCCNDCDNMIFRLNATTGYIEAGAKATGCVGSSSGEGTLSIGDCSPSFAVPFEYNSATAQLQKKSSSTCLTQTKNASATNVWARPLEHGAFAVVFLNNGEDVASVTCDEGCFGTMNITSGQSFTVEDLWNDVPAMPPMTNATFTAHNLEPEGGHLMIKLTPSK